MEDSRPWPSARLSARLRDLSPSPTAVGEFQRFRKDVGAPVPGNKKGRDSETDEE